MVFLKQPLLLQTLLILFGSEKLVCAGRKGSGGSINSGDTGVEPSTEIPTSEYFFLVDNEELLKNFTEVEGSRLKALEYVSKGESRYNNEQGSIELCTHCRQKVGNSTTDVECQENSREVCWSSTGCYRLTFTDLTTQLYHIEKGCWYEDFNGMFGMCMKKCNTKGEGLPSPDERINCYCELCHGPMCNRELLVSAGVPAKSGVEFTLLTYLSVFLLLISL